MCKFLLLLIVSVAAVGQTPAVSRSGDPGQPPANAPPGMTPEARPSAGNCQYTGSHTATIDLMVTAAGLPENEKIAVSSGEPCLDRQALKAVSTYHFHAAVHDGQPVATHIRIQVNFKRF